MPANDFGLKDFLLQKNADLVGFANLSAQNELLDQTFFIENGFKLNEQISGVAIAVLLDPQSINTSNLPNLRYYAEYLEKNKLLTQLATEAANYLSNLGFLAFAQNAVYTNAGSATPAKLPHKTVATLAGFGWIGKNNLLTTKVYGSALRLTSVITNAPLPYNQAIRESNCKNCDLCQKICPAQALSGTIWQPGVTQCHDLVDIKKCAEKGRALTLKSFGKEQAICGRCMRHCLYTTKYLNRLTAKPQ